MSDETLLAASALSKLCEIPLSKLISFIEGYSARVEKQAETAEFRANKYADRTASAIRRRESLSETEYDSFELPRSIQDAYLSTRY